MLGEIAGWLKEQQARHCRGWMADKFLEERHDRSPENEDSGFAPGVVPIA
jgi:hypothetical protein